MLNVSSTSSYAYQSALLSANKTGASEQHDGDFLTTCPILRAALARLPGKGLVKEAYSFLLIGPQGSGHSTFARQAWKKIGLRTRPFVVADCRQIRGIRDVRRLILKAQDGDLYLENVDQLSPKLVLEFGRLVGQDASLRLIGSIKTETKGHLTPDKLQGLFACTIHLSPLQERRGDVLLIVEALLRSEYPGLQCSTSGRQVLDSYAWPRQVGQLVHCLRKSAEAAIAQGRGEVDADLIYAYLRQGEQLYDYSQMLQSLKVTDLVEVAKRWGVKDTLRMIEAAIIAATMRETSDCLSHSASVLKVPINTLSSRKKVLAKHIKAFSHILESNRHHLELVYCDQD